MLSYAKLQSLKARPKVYRVADSKGLCIEIRPDGGRFWRYRYRYAGKPKMLSLGPYSEVSLREARERRDELRAALRAGRDPSAERRAEDRATRIAHANTFGAVAQEWLDRQALAQSTQKKNDWLMKNYAFPRLASRPIAEITSRDLLDLLREVEKTGKHETANRLRIKLGQIWSYAVVEGKAESDVTGPLKHPGTLKAPTVTHRAAITDPKRLGELLRTIDGYEGQPSTSYALRLAPLVFQRPGELRLSSWEEYDLEAGRWAFIATKTNKDHIVPLSRQALALLRQLYEITGPDGYVFPGTRPGRPISENTLNAALRTLGFAGDEVTAHGFRATARTLLDEQLRFPVDWIEQQLGHVVKDPLGRAYNRTKFLDERAGMMQAWANYSDDLKRGMALKKAAERHKYSQ